MYGKLLTSCGAITSLNIRSRCERRLILSDVVKNAVCHELGKASSGAANALMC